MIKQNTHIIKIAIIHLALLAGIGTFYYMSKISEVKNFRNGIEVEERGIVKLQRTYLQLNLAVANKELYYLRQQKAFKDMLKGEKRENEVIYNFRILMKSNPEYDQLRYLDEEGQEIIRVDNTKFGPIVIAGAKLQNKKDRYYFYEAMEMSKDAVYQSPLDLNKENGQVEYPYKPTIRFAIKVFNQEEEKGIIVINYNAEKMLEDFREIAQKRGYNNYLINAEGYYLTGAREKNWAFVFDKQIESARYQEAYPEVWDKLKEISKDTEYIQYYDINALQTIIWVDVGKDGQHDEKDWYIISSVPKSAKAYASSEKAWRIILKRQLPFTPLYLLSIVLSITVIIIMDKRKKYNRSLKEMAEVDFLTGVLNRQAGSKVIKANFNYAIRKEQDFSVCFVDLDNLKLVNDLYGHDEGDAYIIKVVKFVESQYRASDMLVRVGGDEFLLGTYCNRDIVEKKWLKVVEKMEEYNKWSGKPYKVACSHGVASIEESHAKTLTDLIELADQRMYVEKRRKKQKADL